MNGKIWTNRPGKQRIEFTLPILRGNKNTLLMNDVIGSQLYKFIFRDFGVTEESIKVCIELAIHKIHADIECRPLKLDYLTNQI